MTPHADLLPGYKRLRDVRLRLNDHLAGTIPRVTLTECGRKLGLFRDGTSVFDSEGDMSILMDYCLYFPGADGRNLVARYLDESPPPGDSDEMIALREMLSSYYSLFQIAEVERGVGVEVVDLLRHKTGFLVDVGFGNTADKKS
jgi:hypothetical protein